MKRHLAALLACLALAVQSSTPIASARTVATRGAGPNCGTPAQPRLTAHRFDFPRDEAAHDGFEREWWRTFGRVTDDAGKPYDFSVNVSRFALGRCGAKLDAASRWATERVVTTTFELLDERAYHVERDTRVDREAPIGARIGDAGFAISTSELTYRKTGNRFLLALDATKNGLSLEQTPNKRAQALGPGGVMKTGSCDACAAYGYAYTRNQTHGLLRIAGVTHRVSGSTWIEHEFAHRELANGDRGWSRFEVQFDDGRDLDVRITHNVFGIVNAVSGFFVAANGKVRYLHSGDARATDEFGTGWHSGTSGITYPSLWSLDVPFARLDLATVEVVLDQESTSPSRIPYFSGAIDVERVGPPEGDHGHGYVELTGYRTPLSV